MPERVRLLVNRRRADLTTGPRLRNTSGGDRSLDPEGEPDYMPAKKRPAVAPSTPGTEAENSESALVGVAKTIGHVAGKLAVKAGIERAHTASSKKGKLAPKNKQHLPRRVKKARQKATANRI
jgi:hypothetical protein